MKSMNAKNDAYKPVSITRLKSKNIEKPIKLDKFNAKKAENQTGKNIPAGKR